MERSLELARRANRPYRIDRHGSTVEDVFAMLLGSLLIGIRIVHDIKPRFILP